MDLVSVVMHWIKNASEKNTQVLAETMLIYHGVGRGSEHEFLWYSEAAWDPFFEAIDFDWAIIKQLSRKCMLFFCHQDRYCLCPYFALGVFFLFGGLWRETTKETAKDFVFPHLHSLLNDSIAAGITSNIRATIPNKERKKDVSSREHAGVGIGVNVDCSVVLGGRSALQHVNSLIKGWKVSPPPQKEDEHLGAPRQCSDARATTRPCWTMAEVRRW